MTKSSKRNQGNAAESRKWTADEVRAVAVEVCRFFEARGGWPNREPAAQRQAFEVGDADAAEAVNTVCTRLRLRDSRIETWVVTDEAVDDAARILGFDEDDEEHWDYVARLVEALARVSAFKESDPDGHEVWRTGQQHRRLRMVVSRENSTPTVIAVRRPHATWAYPSEPLWLPIPGEH